MTYIRSSIFQGGQIKFFIRNPKKRPNFQFSDYSYKEKMNLNAKYENMNPNAK